MKVIFAGRLAKAAEVSTTKKGSQMIRFSVPDEVGYGDNVKTQWIQCSIFGKRAEGKLSQYLTKGQWVQITGELELNTYTNKEGLEKSSLQVIVSELDILWASKDEDSKSAPTTSKPSVEAFPTLDDDIPF